MSDLISREALKESIQRYMSSNWVMPCNEVLKRIDNAPNVEAFTKEDMAGAYNEGYMCGNKEAEKARNEGEWKIGGKTTHYYYCSICGKDGDLQDNFCRNCGAKMKGG